MLLNVLRCEGSATMKTSTTRFSVVFIIGLMLVVALLVCSEGVVYQDCGYIDNYTGSRKGYRSWYFGVKTQHWYNTSPLESFMQDHYPDALQHNRIRYQGDGKNLWGEIMLREHGRPGPMISLPTELLECYVKKHDDRQNKELYDVLLGGDHTAIDAEIQKVCSFALNSK